MIKSEDESQFANDLLRDTSDARNEWITLNRNDDRSFIVLLTALGREIIRSVSLKRRQPWNMERRYFPKPPLRCYLLSRRVCLRIILVVDGIEIRVSTFPFPYISLLPLVR